ncbi:MAG TPA: hypothetical protein VGD23_11200 [Sphingomicrobium sp.]
MATATTVPRIQTERRFFTGMAIAMALFVFIGFAPTYFLYPVLGTESVRGAGPLTLMVHLHAAVSSAWMLFLIMQAGLIAGRQHEQHMRNGVIGLGLAIAVVVIGVVVAIHSGRVGRTPPDWTPAAFLVFPLTSVALFSGFIGAALMWRRRPDYHKRLILLGTMAILVPAGSRFARYILTGVLPPGPIGGMILSDLFLAALAAYDIRSKGRLHPVTLWGGGLLLLSQPLRLIIGKSDPWTAFATWLIG